MYTFESDDVTDEGPATNDDLYVKLTDECRHPTNNSTGR